MAKKDIPMNIGVTRAEAHTIASILSGDLNVSIVAGGGWAYNHQRGVIFYRQEDLKSLSQIEVVANLLHESGHAKYTGDPRYFNYHQMEKKHVGKMIFLSNAIEDFRVEDLIRNEYPYAKEYLPLDSFKTKYILDKTMKNFNSKKIPKFIKYCFGIYAYIAGYEYIEKDKRVRQMLEETKEVALSGRYMASTQAIMDMLCVEIYDKVKPWLDEWEEEHPDLIGIALTNNEKRSNYLPYEELYRLIYPYIRPTTERLQRILTDNKFDKYQGSYRTGKISSRMLYKFPMGNTKLFQRKVEAKSKDYIFWLLVDESGSMQGDSSRYAAQAALLFSLVLDKLGIQYGIWGFNRDLRKYKSPNEKITFKHRKIFEEMQINTSGKGSDYNCDPTYVKEVGSELINYSSKKVLFVISDGAPAPCGYDSHPNDLNSLESVVTELMHKEIEVIGFGIGGYSNVSNYYPNNVIVNYIGDLPKELVRSLKNKLKK